MKNQMSRGEFIRLGGLSLTGALMSNIVLANDIFSGNSITNQDSVLIRKLIESNYANVKTI